MNKRPTIYEEMARERMGLACQIISLLNEYNPNNNEARLHELYAFSHNAIIDSQSEKSLEKMEGYLTDLRDELTNFRIEYPEIEKNPEIKEKLNQLERELSSSNLF